MYKRECPVPPAEARLRFASLVTINALDYKFKLTAAFQKALDDQEAAVTLHYAHPCTRRSPASTSLNNRKQRHHYLPRGDCGTTPP